MVLMMKMEQMTLTYQRKLLHGIISGAHNFQFPIKNDNIILISYS